MTTSPTDEKICQTKARGLLTAIQASLSVFFPRRDPIVAWLNQFISRSSQKGFILGETEADDLTELEKFLRTYGVHPEAVGVA